MWLILFFIYVFYILYISQVRAACWLSWLAWDRDSVRQRVRETVRNRRAREHKITQISNTKCLVACSVFQSLIQMFGQLLQLPHCPGSVNFVWVFSKVHFRLSEFLERFGVLVVCMMLILKWNWIDGWLLFIFWAATRSVRHVLTRSDFITNCRVSLVAASSRQDSDRTSQHTHEAPKPTANSQPKD